MKRFALLAATLVALTASAADEDPFVWENVFAQQVSPNGRYIMAQDAGATTYVLDTKTFDSQIYPYVYPGDSNCISDNGILVGEDANASTALILQDGTTRFPSAFSDYALSCLEGITPDGTLAVGYVMNGSTQYPVIYDLTTDEMTLLPTPSGRMQGVACHAVSADGKTIGGIMVDGGGFRYTPIVYQLSESGEWEYQIPDMSAYGNEYMFGGVMAMSPDGSKMLTARLLTDITNPYEVVYEPYVYDIVKGEFGELKTSVQDLLPSQILFDGSIMAVTGPTAQVPYVAYILEPGAEDFILFTDFLLERFPQYYAWLDDTLGVDGIVGTDDNGNGIMGHYIVTGTVSISEDYVTIAGGVPEGSFLSYVYYAPERGSGVESVTVPAKKGDDVYYNLQGLPVANPERGLFIHAGRLVRK